MGIDYTHKKYGGEWGGNLISRPGKTKFREIKKGPQTGQTKMEKTRVHGTFKESGAPGTNRKLHKKSSKRLNEIMRLKEKKRQTRTGPGTEKARKKRLSHLQSGGYKAGGAVTRFRSSGPEGKPHSTKEGRSAEAQRAYMRQRGPQEPRRKRLTPADTTHRDRLKKIENLHERMGGGTKAKPHSSREGRVASGKRRLDRYRKKAEDVMSGKPKWPKWKKQPKHVPAKRAKHAIGGAVKTIPKITKKFLDFIKTGKHVDKHGVKVNVPKAAERLTGKPHVDHGKRKRIKHLGKGKAEGGRIGLKKGSVHTPGSHSWWLMNQSKPKRTKKAEGGRVNFRHGGSVGAAIKGHGAEIK